MKSYDTNTIENTAQKLVATVILHLCSHHPVLDLLSSLRFLQIILTFHYTFYIP